jgi:hypothetical protein
MKIKVRLGHNVFAYAATEVLNALHIVENGRTSGKWYVSFCPGVVIDYNGGLSKNLGIKDGAGLIRLVGNVMPLVGLYTLYLHCYSKINMNIKDIFRVLLDTIQL